MKKSNLGWIFVAVVVAITAICGIVITEVICSGKFVSDSEEENDKPHILVMFSEAKSAYQFADSVKAHCVYPGCVYITFPTELGTLYKASEIAEIYEVCKEYGPLV